LDSHSIVIKMRHFALLLLLLCSLSIYAKFPSDTPKLTKDSFDGDSLVTTDAQEEEISFVHNFPFTDKRMQANQETYERVITKAIFNDLSKSQNITESSSKYPHDSPIYLTIENKFAYHLFLDEYGISLYTFSYDFGLSSCGTNVFNLKILHIEQKKGDIFNLQSIPNHKYKLIIERMIKESSKFTKSKEEQEIPLFITIHPTLTFLPSALIEDKLDNLRIDFPSANVRYCKECPNLIPFDEYAYLTWLTINAKTTENNLFFKPNDQFVINLGFHPKAIFSSYPLHIIPQNNENDKVATHQYCLNQNRNVDAFVQNAFYERSLDKFTSDLLFYTAREVADKHNTFTPELEVKFPCYPQNFKEKLESFLIVGTGNLKECKNLIKNFMQKNFIKSESSQAFDLPTFDMPWPLESLKGTKALEDAKIYVESEDLEMMYGLNLSTDKYKSLNYGQISSKIEEYCTDFLTGKAEKVTKEHLNVCVHLLYTNSLLTKAGLKNEKELQLKTKSGLAEDWLKGVTIRNIEFFHALEKEWFYSIQDRALESYLVKTREVQEVEKAHAVNMTFALIASLAVAFWAAFIVRFRNSPNVMKSPQKVK